MIGNINPSAGVNTEPLLPKNLSFAPFLSSLSLSQFRSPYLYRSPFLFWRWRCNTEPKIHSYTSHVCQMSDLSLFPCSLSSQIFHRIKIRFLSKTRLLSRMNYFVQEQERGIINYTDRIIYNCLRSSKGILMFTLFRSFNWFLALKF